MVNDQSRQFDAFDHQIEAPPIFMGGVSVCVRRCPTFPPGLGSIIGAGRLSFRVRDGSGRFPVAVTAVTLCGCRVAVVWPARVPGVFGGGVWVWVVVWLRGVCWVLTFFQRGLFVGCCKFSAG